MVPDLFWNRRSRVWIFTLKVSVSSRLAASELPEIPDFQPQIGVPCELTISR